MIIKYSYFILLLWWETYFWVLLLLLFFPRSQSGRSNTLLKDTSARQIHADTQVWFIVLYLKGSEDIWHTCQARMRSLTHSSQLAFVFFLVRALRRAGEYPSMPRVERRVTLSQGEHRGILKITHTHTCRQSGVSVSHDLLDRLLPVGGNRSILNKPTQNVEERETPNEKRVTAAWSFYISRRWQSHHRRPLISTFLSFYIKQVNPS